MIDREIPQIGDMNHLADGKIVAIRRRLIAQHDLLRTQRHPYRHVVHHRGVGVNLQRMHQARRAQHQAIFEALFHQSFKDVHRADELGAVAGGRVFVNLFRFANLHKLAAVHDGDTARHGHGLFLIVGHHHAGHANALKNIHHLQLHAIAQLFIQRPHRFVEQQQLRSFRQTARQRDTLALAARELVRLTFSELLHVHQSQHLLHPGGDFRLRQTILFQAEGDILLNGHMGKQGVGLEHHIDRPLIGRHARQIHAVEHNLPGGRLFKARQHA